MAAKKKQGPKKRGAASKPKKRKDRVTMSASDARLARAVRDMPQATKPPTRLAISPSDARALEAVQEASKGKPISKAALRRALGFAREASASSRSWTDLHNSVFGIGGFVTKNFTTEAQRVAFNKTTEFKAIIGMIDHLREPEEGDTPDADLAELAASANGKILVRVPRVIHAALLTEARAEGVSLNQLCLAKLCTQLRAVV